jgi:hypothetical protein
MPEFMATGVDLTTVKKSVYPVCKYLSVDD